MRTAMDRHKSNSLPLCGCCTKKRKEANKESSEISYSPTHAAPSVKKLNLEAGYSLFGKKCFKFIQ